MLARLALASEIEAVIALAKQCCEERAPHLEFSEAVARKTFQAYMTTANPTVLVVEGDDRDHSLIGLAVAWFNQSAFSDTHSIGLDVLHVSPNSRHTPAAALLAKAFDEFATRTEPREIFVMTPHTSETADASNALLARGYQVAGTMLHRVPSDG